MADFNFNLPYRQQAVTRNPQLPPPLNRHHQYQHLPREPHGFHLFCGECFKRIFLGSTAFKFYLLVAWCVGLTGLMFLQTPAGTKNFLRSVSEKQTDSLSSTMVAVLLVYLLSQVFGLLAVVMEMERIFIPYVVILAFVTITNIVMLSIEIARAIGTVPEPNFKLSALKKHCLMSLVYAGCLLYNTLCLATVVHLCAHFDKKRLINQRRRREEIAQNARIYNRLVELNNREAPVSVNVDSPPKYSSLAHRPSSICTPPPGYSQLKNYENVKDELVGGEKTSHRSLFK